MLFFISRFKKAVKTATHQVRKEESQIVAVVQQGLESMQVIKAFGRQDMEQKALAEVSHATVNAALKARKVKSLLSPIVTITVAFCTAIVLWRGAALILQRRYDGWRVNGLPCLPQQVFQAGERLATTTNAIAQAAVGVDRVRAILDTDTILPEARGCIRAALPER